MKRCAAPISRNLDSFRHGPASRRWASYKKAALNEQALLQKLESGLGEDEKGNPLKIDLETKTLSTAAGPLPISPVFDPAWMKARRRQEKDENGSMRGRFRRKLASNPFARALSTPMRRCLNTRISLPRYFLQDFEWVQHPTTGKPWWAPGPLSFATSHQHGRLQGRRATATESPRQGEDEEDPSINGSVGTAEAERAIKENDGRPFKSPLTSYVLSRKSLIDALHGTRRAKPAPLLALRNGMAVPANEREAIWRPDMADVLLRLMRQHAIEGLATRANKARGQKYRFFEPLKDWDELGNVSARGCVLWLPQGDNEAAGQYATVDIPGVKYGAKMPVHNLNRLLGEEEVNKLKDNSPIFRENEMLVMKNWRSERMTSLHLLLWRLQGFLADTGSP